MPRWHRTAAVANRRAACQAAPHSGKPQTETRRFSEGVRCWMSKSAKEDQRRNAMQQFIAKFEKDIQGVMSGFDRVLFRGSLRRLNHSKGMKWYLAQNNILCKQYEDHVKAVSQKVKKAALEPFHRQNLLVKHVYGRDDKEQIARAFAAEKSITEGDVCALSAMEMAPTFQHYKTEMVIRPRV